MRMGPYRYVLATNSFGDISPLVLEKTLDDLSDAGAEKLVRGRATR